MIDEASVIKEARRLDGAEKNRQQVAATSSIYTDMDIQDAYRIQNAWVGEKLKRGAQIIGHKIGLTSRTMQRAMHIDEPDFGVLLDDMLFSNGAVLSADAYLDPRIEVELAFILKRKLNMENLTVAEVLDATAKVIPALELIAARTFRQDPNTGYIRTVRDTISDNAANAGVIIGDTVIDPKVSDLRWVPSLLYKNDVIEETGVSAGVLDHPANGIIWLARKYASINRELLPGQIILSGSFTKPVTIKAGDQIKADFGDYGKLTCQFE